MLGKGLAKGKNIFSDVKQTLYEFLDTQVQSGDSVDVIPFDIEPIVPSPTFIGSEEDKASVRKTVEGLQAKGLYTYIALAVHQVKELVRKRQTAGASRKGDRRSCVVIFTDGIDEPPPHAELNVNLQQALRDFPKENTYFYFVNLGDVSVTNTLYQTMRANSEFPGKVLDHPQAKDLDNVAAGIGQAVVAPFVDFFVRLVEPPAQFLPEQYFEIKPVEISATAPSQAELRIEKSTPGLQVEVIEPLPLKLDTQPWRPHVRVRGDRALNNLGATAELRLVPVGDITTRQTAPSVLLMFRFHSRTILERLFPWLVALVIIAAIARAIVFFYRRWHTVEVEGLLYVQSAGQYQALEPVNLKLFRRSEVVIGGSAGLVCPGESSFRFSLRAEGSGGRVRQLQLIRDVGIVTVNGLESLARLYHDDEIRAGNHKFKYENFALQRPVGT
jgi:hypothetical protein